MFKKPSRHRKLNNKTQHLKTNLTDIPETVTFSTILLTIDLVKGLRRKHKFLLRCLRQTFKVEEDAVRHSLDIDYRLYTPKFQTRRWKNTNKRQLDILLGLHIYHSFIVNLIHRIESQCVYNLTNRS